MTCGRARDMVLELDRKNYYRFRARLRVRLVCFVFIYVCVFGFLSATDYNSTPGWCR